MATWRKVVSVGSILLILANIALIDYGDLSWRKNAGSYTGIVAMSLVALGALMPQKKNEDTKK